MKVCIQAYTEKKRGGVLTSILLGIAVLAGCSGATGGGGTPELETEKYAVTFSVEGSNGSIKAEVDGAEITSGAEVEKDKVVKFTATPEEGYRADAWTGATPDEGLITASLTVTSAATVTVKFVSSSTPVEKYAVTFSVDGSNGSIKAEVDGTEITSGTAVEKGRSVKFTATPDTGFAAAWTVATPDTADSNKASLTVTGAATVKVKFVSSSTPVEKYAITFSVDGTNGTIAASVDGAAITSGTAVEKGKEVKFSATPDSDYVSSWTGATPDAGDTNKAALVVTEAAAVKVKFIHNLVVSTQTFNKTTTDGAFAYTLVTYGSGSYTVTPSDSSVISATINEHGNATVTPGAQGTSTLTVKDTITGQTGTSGVITVTKGTELPDYFEEGGVYYKVSDKTNRKVQLCIYKVVGEEVQSSDSAEYTGTLHIPATVSHNSVSYTVTAIQDNRPDLLNSATLTAVTVDGSSTYFCAQDGVLFNKDKTTLVMYPNGKAATSYTMPDTVTKLGSCSFKEAANLTELTFSSALERIEDYTIYDMSALATLSALPAALTYIGSFSFENIGISSLEVPEGVTIFYSCFLAGCNSLTSVTLPGTVENIYWYAFSYSPNLKTVTVKAATPPAISTSDNVFKDTPIGSATLYVPSESVEAYKAADVWKNFGTITAMP